MFWNFITDESGATALIRYDERYGVMVVSVDIYQLEAEALRKYNVGAGLCFKLHGSILWHKR